MITTTVTNCARCGLYHTSITFTRFVQPPVDATHWGTCPETGDPILLTVRQVPAVAARPDEGWFVLAFLPMQSGEHAAWYVAAYGHFAGSPAWRLWGTGKWLRDTPDVYWQPLPPVPGKAVQQPAQPDRG